MNSASADRLAVRIMALCMDRMSTEQVHIFLSQVARLAAEYCQTETGESQELSLDLALQKALEDFKKSTKLKESRLADFIHEQPEGIM